MPKLAASVAMMFNEVALLDRFGRAAALGFQGVEIQAPYRESKEHIAARVRQHKLTPALMNLPVAVAAIPGEEAAFREALSRALEYANEAGCKQLHCLAGRTSDPAAEATFVSNLRWGAEQARPHGVRLLLEPLNTQENPRSLRRRRCGGVKWVVGPCCASLCRSDFGGRPTRELLGEGRSR